MKKLWILLVAAAFAVGCSDNSTEEGGETPNLITLSAENLNFMVDGTGVGGNNAVTVTSDGDWRLIGYQSWCTPSAITGKSGDKVTFTVAENPSNDARMATYTFIRGNKAMKLTVSQLQNSVYEPVGNESFAVNARSQTITFIVRTSFDITPEIDADWITETERVETRGVETRFLRFLIDANEDYSARSGKIIVTDIEGVPHELIVNQNQKHAMIFAKKRYDVEAVGGLVTVALDTNIDYTVSIGSGYSSWIQEEPNGTRALSPSQKVFRIAESAETRQGRVIFKYSPADGSAPLADTVFIAQRVGETVKVDVPDVNFRYVLNMNDYVITTPGETMCEMTAKGTALKTLSCSNWMIGSLKGIEGFTSLTSLSCNYNNLTELDLSGLPGLTTVNCSSNQLATLNLSANTELVTLNCSNNLLETLDVKENKALATLTCNNNLLGTLNTQANTKLTSLNCSYNKIGSLDLDANTALTTLNCSYNELLKLDLTACGVLRTLSPSTNPLGELLLNPAANVTSLTFSSLGNVSATVVSSKIRIVAPKVTSISCFNVKLKELDITGCPAVTSLNCYGNELTAIDLSGSKNLKTLNCYGNKLSALDVQYCTELTSINCNTNALKTLDVSANLKVTTLNCSTNPDMTTLYMAEGQTIRSLTKDAQTEIVRK